AQCPSARLRVRIVLFAASQRGVQTPRFYVSANLSGCARGLTPWHPAAKESRGMPIQIVMPTLSPTMDKGKLAKWRVKEGQQVKPGDVICEVETDKATIEVEAVDAGRMGRLLVAEGTADVKVNTPIAMLEGESTSRGGGGLATRMGAVRPLSSPRSGPPPQNPGIVPTARPGEMLGSGGAAPAGTVIGRARLKGDHGPAPQAG